MELDLEGYRTLFDCHPRPMFISERASMRIVLANRAAVELYEWSLAELQQMTLRDIRPPEEVAHFHEVFADFRKHEQRAYSRFARHWTKRGRIMEVTLEITRVVLAGGECALAVVTEVTGIAEMERRFRLLVERSHDGIVVTNKDGIIEYTSPGSERILGFKAADVIGTRSKLRAHPDDVRDATPPLPGETRHYVARVSHRDGSWRWIEATTTNLTHDPAVRAFVSNYRDITARKELDEALRRSEASFRTLIERAPMLVFVQRDGRFVYVNPATLKMLGYTEPGQLIGRPVLEVIHPDDRESIRARMGETVAHGETPRSSARLVRADGESFTAECAALRLVFDGEPASVVIGTDVTARDALFARLALADRMLTVGTLAAGVAHEINNPLAYIGTNLEILAAELPKLAPGDSRLGKAELASVLADAREGAERVSAIVRELRALARHDGDEARGPVELAAVLESSIKMAHNEIRHRARIVTDFAPGLPPAVGDAGKLGQVALNLLVNAAQAIEPGRAALHEICVRAWREGADRVAFSVSDTGAGIPPHIIGRIFDPFFTTKETSAGMGLGLSISHEIVRAFGGEIAVDSRVGAGSTFRVTLPIAESIAVARTSTPGLGVPAGAARVLLIDDEPAVGRSLCVLLAPEHAVTAVTRADDALALLAAGERYDAILCDLMMPDTSGVELYAKLRELAPACLPRMVFMTGGAFTAEARDFLARLERPALAKPFTEAKVRGAIAEVVQQLGPVARG